MDLKALGDPGPATRRRNIPSQIEVLASSYPIPMASGWYSSGPSGPSPLEKLRVLHEMAKEHPWMLLWLAKPGAVSLRHQGHNGAEDTPPASLSMICNKFPLAPPAAPHARLVLTTPERPIEHPFPPPEYTPATINKSLTPPPALEIHQAGG